VGTKRTKDARCIRTRCVAIRRLLTGLSGLPDWDPVSLLGLEVSVLRPRETASGTSQLPALEVTRKFPFVWAIRLCPRVLLRRLVKRHALSHVPIATYGQDITLGYKVAISPATYASAIWVKNYGSHLFRLFQRHAQIEGQQRFVSES
jgi:hypothetical protein